LIPHQSKPKFFVYYSLIFQARSRFLPLVLLGLLPMDLVLLCGSAVNASGFVQQVCTQGSFFFRVSVLRIFGTGPATEFSYRSLPPPKFPLDPARESRLQLLFGSRLEFLSFCCSELLYFSIVHESSDQRLEVF
jgi:hypothetical protein